MLINIETAKKLPGKSFAAEFNEIPSCQEFPIKQEIAEPVRVKMEYTFSDDVLYTRGSFSAKLKVCCSRCLADMLYEVNGEFAEQFAAQLTDEISYQLTGDEVSIDKLILDSILAELPQRYLCKEDCKGFCPVCGADLNKQSCGCNRNDDLKTTNPFAKLEGLFDNTEEV